MAAAAPSSCIGTTLLLNTTTNSRSTDLKYSPPLTLHSEGHCSVLRRSSYLQRSSALRRSVNSPSSYKCSVVRNATPEAAGDLLSSLAGIPDISLLGDNPWLAGAGAAGLSAAVPLTVQRLLKLRKWVNTAVEPVEVVAEVPPQPAQKVEELMEKVKELDEKLEALLNKHSNSTNISVNINCFGNSERLQ
ncbi:uncharacterized protein LOC105164188 [Sesamum indicum]|uniref:Uncharacterized protein LOC105164188 n=1 Tax=Sesamum indicum TaxID=4182 RepID=A0A6I9TJT2_SESIN|nr:uncharacterized protein LOC105164188 [Sesamum indicum]